MTQPTLFTNRPEPTYPITCPCGRSIGPKDGYFKVSGTYWCWTCQGPRRKR